MKFEWDEEKDRKNRAKHGIDFETALRVFYDVNRIECYDRKHSVGEDRYLTIGEVCGTLLVLTVVYTERGDAIRLISARRATVKERKMYYAGQEGI